MAQVVNKNRDLVNGYLRFRLLSVIGFVLTAVFFILFAASLFGFKTELCLIFIVFLIGSAIFGGIMNQKANILGSGVQGEGRMIGIIEQLPDPYTGFQNVMVSYDGKTSELDMVVIGLTGIFVIEVKNHGGTIVGDTADRNWVQHKVGRGGTPYSNEFYSPLKQVGTHVYRLAHYLRGHGINVHVESIVYFANPETTVQLSGNQTATPVFCAAYNGEQNLVNYILSRPESVSKEDLVKAFMLLDGRSQAETEWALNELRRPLNDEETAQYSQTVHAAAQPNTDYTQYTVPVSAASPYCAPQQPDRPLFCGGCGRRLGTADRFCQNCGKRIV